MLCDSSLQFCGCCILSFGIYFLVHNKFGVLFHNVPSLTLGNVLVIVGSIIMVVAFLGCMGSIKENKCLLLSVSLSQTWRPLAGLGEGRGTKAEGPGKMCFGSSPVGTGKSEEHRIGIGLNLPHINQHFQNLIQSH